MVCEEKLSGVIDLEFLSLVSCSTTDDTGKKLWTSDKWALWAMLMNEKDCCPGLYNYKSYI